MNVKPKKSGGEPVDTGVEAGVLKVGFDFGTNTSVVCWGDGAGEDEIKSRIVFTVVGHAKPGVLPGILPAGKTTLFGDEAIKYRLHLNLKWPMEKGVVIDVDTSKEFASYIRSLVDPDGTRQLWGVMGCPANATPDKLRDQRHAVAHVFSKLLVVPEPFLAAMGLRDESRLSDPHYIDPTRNSLIVDIGAGTTDFCMVQGYYPGSDEQISVSRAGNDIDKALAAAIAKRYPDCNISGVSITRLKEQNSFVGPPKKQIVVTIPVNGKPRQLDITDQIRLACESILDDILRNVEELISRCDSDAVEELLANIVLTGGGSLIGGICELIEERLRERGYLAARVQRVPDYKRLVARGALKIAHNVRDDQWQIPV